jgi:hypothetical protein
MRLGDAPNTQWLATASVSNYAHERRYAEQNPTWHKAQIMHIPKEGAGICDARGLPVSIIVPFVEPLKMRV